MFVNGLFSGARTSTDNFTAYINPYLVVSRGGNYTKHIYIGSQRIVSKLGDLDSYGQDPRRIAYAGSEVDGASVDFANKYRDSQQTIKDRYSDFGVEYRGEDNDDYVNGGGFCCDDAPQLRAGTNDNPELYQYYYHSDHLGSTSLITNLDGEIVQHVEYVPFGEVFIEERNNTWNTPYLFNAKELDEETGLYYYGARYYDSRVSVWLGVDPMWEKYQGISTYAYCLNNPIKYIDPDGRKIKFVVRQTNRNVVLTYGNGNFWHSNGQRYNPQKENLSKTLYRILAAYRKILDSGDNVLINQLKTLETSERTHWVEASQHGENNVRPYSTNTVSEDNKTISDGKGIETQTQFDFSKESIEDFQNSEGVPCSDFTTVVHEMRHQYDYDTGNMKDSQNVSGAKDPAEKRAINNENRARKIEKLPKRTSYGGEKIKGLD